jgi:hypothetical protein
MNICTMKEEIKDILYDYVKQINAYNLVLEKFCRNNLFHERCGNKELNIARDCGAQNKIYTHFKADDGHVCPCTFVNSLKRSQKQHKEMPTYETDPGTCGKPTDSRDLKGI